MTVPSCPGQGRSNGEIIASRPQREILSLPQFDHQSKPGHGANATATKNTIPLARPAPWPCGLHWGRRLRICVSLGETIHMSSRDLTQTQGPQQSSGPCRVPPRPWFDRPSPLFNVKDTCVAHCAARSPGNRPSFGLLGRRPRVESLQKGGPSLEVRVQLPCGSQGLPVARGRSLPSCAFNFHAQPGLPCPRCGS